MRNFIKKSLEEVRDNNLEVIDFQCKRENGDTIALSGKVKKKLATFVVSRTKENGHNCSNIPVKEMPLTDDCIKMIAELVVENL